MSPSPARWASGCLLFCAAACTNTAGQADSPSSLSPSETTAGLSAFDDSASAEGLATTAFDQLVARVRNTEAAIQFVDGEYVGVQPAVGMKTRFSSAGVRAEGTQGEITLSTVGFGREGAIQAVLAPDPYLGGCTANPSIGADEVCIPRLEYDRDGLVEWWSSAADRAQVGWDLVDRPNGNGLLEIRVRVQGATIESAAGEAGVRLQAGDQTFGYSDLRAWDAGGHLLPAWIEIEGDSLRILVDDDEAEWPIFVDPVLTSYSWYSLGSSGYYTGSSVSGAGDVNNDGYDDVIVGAPGYSSHTGRAYVYHGSSSGLSYSIATTLTGGGTSYYFGDSVDGAGDINGDGYDDVVVGAYYYSSGTGMARTFHGSSAGISSSSSVTLYGSTSYSFGRSVAGAGDVNRDGYDDVIIGAPGYSSSTGRAYVYHGTSSGISSVATTITGSGTSSGLGFSVAAAGDVNNDGYDDVVVGAYSYSSGYGRAYVHHGASSGVSSSASRTLTGSSASEYFGFRVAGVGSVNGDAYDDIAVSAPYYSSYTGRVAVYHGSSSGIGSSASTNLYGYTTYNYFGYGLGGAGDTDNDGYSDLIVGSFGYSSYTGLAEVFPGSTSGTSSTEDTSLPGLTTNAYQGYSVNGAGDVNGDGYADVLVGSYYYGSGAGLALAYLGYTEYPDDDHDGYYVDGSAYEDCDDTNASVYPGATETTGNGRDDNCDGTEACYDDDDNDGYLDSVGDVRTSTDADCSDAYEGTNTDPTTDCDDSDASDYPGATETTGNGDDENCDGTEICYSDADNDGYPTSTTVTSADTDCNDSGEGTATEYSAGVDCNDSSTAIKPGAPEITGDEVDSNCDGMETCYVDADRDGYAVSTTVSSSDSDCADAGEATATTFARGVDCSDSSSSISPGATEICDASNTDEDCDGNADDSDSSVSAASRTTWYYDGDGDGYGTSGTSSSRCDQPSGYVDNDDDCDDSDSSVGPGGVEVVGEGGDEDCDGYSSCYADVDGDGYATTTLVFSADSDCSDAGEASSTKFAKGLDCNDGNADVNPGEDELCDAANLDEDCDSAADDADSGVLSSTKTTHYTDADGDGYGSDASVASSCDVPSGNALVGGDCADGDAGVYPSAPESTGDEVDSDCDGSETCFSDVDGDGWATSTEIVSADADCADSGEASAATYALGVDCDDRNLGVSPSQTEVCDSANVDENCNGVADDSDAGASGQSTTYTDADGDGFGDEATLLAACDPPATNVAVAGDCDDADSAANPDETEVCDSVNRDDDCDGKVNLDDPSLDPTSTVEAYTDADRDGFGTDSSAHTACELAVGEVSQGGDCDDTNDAFYPGAPESDCEDPADYNCDGSSGSIDGDGDGYLACDDCDDSSAGVNPRAAEVCNEIDDDCDGITDGGTASDATVWYPDVDADGYGAISGITDCTAPEGYIAESGDCDDQDASRHPGVTETCDGTDENCDGTADEGACDGDTGPTADGGDDKGNDDLGTAAAPPEGCGCSTPTPPSAAASLLSLALGLIVRRRRATLRA